MTLSIFMCLTLPLVGCLEDGVPRTRSLEPVNIFTDTDPDDEKEDEVEETTGVTRPDQAIKILNACVCQNGQELSYGANCESICATKPSSELRTLFFDTEINEADFNTANLSDVQDFCTTQDDEQANVGCEIEIKKQDGSLALPLEFAPGDGASSFSFDVGSLDTNETLRVSIVERTSGSKSQAVQIYITEDGIEDKVGGPLAMMPVSEYTCMARIFSSDPDTGEIFNEGANRFHFYFIQETRPEPLKASTIPSFYCHDIAKNPSTPINSPLLEEKTGAFTVWDKNDPRFFDLDSNGSRDIADILKEEVELQGATPTASLDFFFPLQFPSGIDDGDSNIGDDGSNSAQGSTISSDLGFAMTPFIDTDTLKAYCPTMQHYYSSSPIFKAMREVVGVGTEAVYVAKQDNVCDHILVKESLVSKIWFYEEAGQNIVPTSDTISGKKIQFYWPADLDSPYIQKVHQRVYSIISVSELNSSACSGGTGGIQNGQDSSDSSTVPTTLPAHDKRVGCIPILND